MSDLITHPPCQCDGPTATCPRYGWMKGHKYTTCAGHRNLSPEKRDALLSVWLMDPVHTGGTPISFSGNVASTRHTPPFNGPGRKLKELLTKLKLPEPPGCGCATMMNKMNGWGVAGCREHRQEIIDHLNKARNMTSWYDKARAAVIATATPDLIFRLDIADPVGSIVDEAIRLAEVENDPTS